VTVSTTFPLMFHARGSLWDCMVQRHPHGAEMRHAFAPMLALAPLEVNTNKLLYASSLLLDRAVMSHKYV
jgi:hypothetical protein